MDPYPTFNEPLATKALDHIAAHPEEWAQQTWRCKSGMCYAGTTVDLVGYRWRNKDEADPFILVEDPTLQALMGNIEHCSHAAVRELGLTEPEAGCLFQGDNTLEDLTEMVGMLRDGIRGEPFTVRFRTMRLRRGGEEILDLTE